MTLDLVKSFHINPFCAGIFPCNHSTITTLSDGRVIHGNFNALDIARIISSLPIEKIIFGRHCEDRASHCENVQKAKKHFEPYLDRALLVSVMWQSKSINAIISRLFSETL